MDLETRVCPSCKKTYKVITDSKQEFCSRRCFEFRGGKQNSFGEKELGFYRRFGFLTPSIKFTKHQVREK